MMQEAEIPLFIFYHLLIKPAILHKLHKLMFRIMFYKKKKKHQAILLHIVWRHRNLVHSNSIKCAFQDNSHLITLAM